MKLQRWIAEPWRCPECGGEHVLVRDVALPGGKPGELRRDTTVVYAARCVDCSAEWIASFEAAGVSVLKRGKARGEVPN